MNSGFLSYSLAATIVCGLSCFAPHLNAQSSQPPDEAAAFKAAGEKPTPRTADGHPNLTGYWETYPSSSVSQRSYVGADGVTYSAFVPRPGGASRPAPT